MIPLLVIKECIVVAEVYFFFHCNVAEGYIRVTVRLILMRTIRIMKLAMIFIYPYEVLGTGYSRYHRTVSWFFLLNCWSMSFV